MRIGEIAKSMGVSQATIRRLERRGVIAAQRDWAGHRRYTEDDVAKIRVFLFGSDQPSHPTRGSSPDVAS